MRRCPATQDDYVNSANEFKGLIDRWIILYNESSSIFGAKDTMEFFQVGKCIEKTVDTFDEMMFNDYPLLKFNTRSTRNYFWESVFNVYPRYIYDKSEKIKETPGLKNVPLPTYKKYAHLLHVFRDDLIKFKVGLCKFHGKTRIRILLDSGKHMDSFYFGLESRMYREHQYSKDLINIF